MDEFDDDDSQEEPEAEEPKAEDPRFKKLQAENQSLRRRLRRSELVGNFGETVAGLVPDELPLEKWEEYASKLAEALPKAEATETETEEATEEPPVEEAPPGTAAVVRGPAPGTSQSNVGAEMSATDLGRLAKEDSAAFYAAIAAKYANEG